MPMLADAHISSFAPQILHKPLFLNAPGSITFSQEHFKTISYAKFGGQKECIMGNSKIVNWRGKAYFQCTIIAFRPLFIASILNMLEEADRQHADDRFWLFYGI